MGPVRHTIRLTAIVWAASLVKQNLTEWSRGHRVTMGNAPSLERAMRAAPELASEHGLELNRFSKKQAAASTGAMSR